MHKSDKLMAEWIWSDFWILTVILVQQVLSLFSPSKRDDWTWLRNVKLFREMVNAFSNPMEDWLYIQISIIGYINILKYWEDPFTVS